MKSSEIPFNVELIRLDSQRLQRMRAVSTTDVMDTSGQRLGPLDKIAEQTLTFSGNERVVEGFHDDGLFSTIIFGRIGEDERDTRFSYIDIKVKIFHPVIHKALVKLKGLYGDIMTGRTYAIWNDQEKDFEAADEATGETGYQFFVKHWQDIKFRESRSPVRSQKIKLIRKFQDRAMYNKILVMPAGLRDVRVLSGGRLDFDEINDIYRRMIGLSRTIASSDEKVTSKSMDYSRHLLQQAFNEIYDYITRMLKDKGGLLQNKWASRRVFNGTRNVISSMDTSRRYIGGKDAPRVTDTITGLFQLMKGVLPLTIYLLRNGYLGEALGIGTDEAAAQLVDTKSWKRETVDLPPVTKDRWTTLDGLEKVIQTFQDPKHRHDPVMIDGRYLALIYKGPDKTFRIFGDIDELPEGFDRQYVSPISLVELLYLSGYRRWNDIKVIVTRYPVTGLGSTYPSTVYVKTSIVGESRRELGMDWQPLDEEYTAIEFPTKEPLAFVDSLIPSPLRLGGMGGDFDGDTVSAIFVYSDEALEECHRLLHSRSAYVDPAGGLRTSAATDTLKLVIHNMTGE